MPPDFPKGSRLRRSKLASSCSEVSLRPWFPLGFGAKKDRGRGFSVFTEREMKREPLVPRSLLLNRTEMLATQAITNSEYVKTL